MFITIFHSARKCRVVLSRFQVLGHSVFRIEASSARIGTRRDWKVSKDDDILIVTKTAFQLTDEDLIESDFLKAIQEVMDQ